MNAMQFAKGMSIGMGVGIVIKSGGSTPVSAIIHCVFLLLVLLFIGKWAAMIPLFWYQLVHAVQEGLVPAGTKTTEFVVKNRTLLLAGLYGVVLVWIALGMGPEILAYLRS